MANLEHVGRRSAERAGNPSLTLNNHRFWRRLEAWLPAIIIGLGLALWELFSRTGRLSALFFPAPTTIVASLFRMILNGKMAIHLGATAERLAIGFAIGGTAGLLLGLAMGWSQRLRQIIDPIIAAIHPIPKIAIFPLIMIIFGIGESSKIVAISIAAFFPMLINCMSGVRQLNPVYFEVTQNYRASPWKTFSRVIVPGSLPLNLDRRSTGDQHGDGDRHSSRVVGSQRRAGCNHLVLVANAANRRALCQPGRHRFAGY